MDENTEKIKPGDPQAGKPARLVLALSLTEDNQLTVTGPIENKAFCIGLLADAVKIVLMYSPPKKPEAAPSAPSEPEEKKQG